MKKIIGEQDERDIQFLSILNENGFILNANDRMMQTFGLKGHKSGQIDFVSLIHPVNQENFRNILQQCRLEGVPGTTELFLKNGHYLPMKWKIIPFQDPGLNKQQYFCAGTRLPEKEQLLISFMQHNPGLAWIVDEDTRLVTASQSFYSHFNLDPNKSEGKLINELVPSTVFHSLFEKHKQVMEHGVPMSLIEKMKWVDETEFVFHISIFSLQNLTGKKMVAGQAVNIAEKYAVEKQLRDTNERLLLMTRASSNAIWEWDMQTGYIFRNDALMDMIGYPQEPLHGLAWWLRRIHPEDRDRVSDKVKDVTDKGKQSWEEEYRFKCADGIYKHMLDKGFVVYENGLPVRMIGSLQDISGVKQLEYDLIEEKIRHQKDISEIAIRVQEKERTRIGHELHDNVNQILSTTKLFVDLLMPVTTEEKQIKEKCIGYLQMAISEIRKLSKELVTPELHENGLINSIGTLVNDLTVSTKMQIRFTHDQAADLLDFGKQVTIFRIIQEQLKNILSHSQAKRVDINLQAGENEILLIVRDDGKGFNTQQTSKGIGISNIHKRVKYYNGTVSIQSSPGKGCVLEIRLPVEPANVNSGGD